MKFMKNAWYTTNCDFQKNSGLSESKSKYNYFDTEIVFDLEIIVLLQYMQMAVYV